MIGSPLKPHFSRNSSNNVPAALQQRKTAKVLSVGWIGRLPKKPTKNSQPSRANMSKRGTKQPSTTSKETRPNHARSAKDRQRPSTSSGCASSATTKATSPYPTHGLRTHSRIQGWIPREPQDHLNNPLPLQGHGCWQTLEPLALRPWQGLAVTLDATPSCPGMGVRPLHTHLFTWSTCQKGHHNWHASWTADQSQGSVSRATHLGPVRAHPSECHRPTWHSVGSMDQPQEKKRFP